jgi:DNA-directed RNA polymerase I, II, and III subunit RPABC2
MSDDEYYSENDDSGSEISENDIINSSKKNPLIKPSINIKSYDIDDFEPDAAAEADEDEEEDEDEDDEIQLGGDDDEESEENTDDSDDSDIEIDEDGEPIKKDVPKKLNKSTQKMKKPQLIVQDEDEDEDEDDDENYLQKFDNDLMKNYINEFHPECLSHNYDEITKLSIVIRNSDNIIIDPLHKTIPYLTKYEKARILGQRAKQIEGGAKPLVKIPENIVDSYIIAELELKEKKIPFIIRRPIPGGACEYWNLKDLEMITF